eukprot:8906493-Heterocapsa_arctica.AAC.1
MKTGCDLGSSPKVWIRRGGCSIGGRRWQRSPLQSRLASALLAALATLALALFVLAAVLADVLAR